MTAPVLVYFPFNPWPPRAGSHRRCLQMLDGLVQLGARVHLASRKHQSEQPWTKEAIWALRARGLENVWLYKRFRGQGRFERWEARFVGQDRWLADWEYCSWWQRRWFRNLVRRIHPSTVVMHYAFADRLLDHSGFPNLNRIIEMHDLLSVNVKIRSELDKRVKQFIRTGQAGDLFDTNLRWADKLIPADEEVAIYDKYDAVVAISRHEGLLLEQKLQHARVVWIPMHIPEVKFINSYDAPPIFLASGNKLNQAGLLLLLNEVIGRTGEMP